MAITTSMCTSFKQELLSGGHCFNATVSPTFTIASASTTITNVSSMSGVAVGMAFSCATSGIPANTVVARITTNNQAILSNASTAAITGGTATVAGDSFVMALIKAGMTGTYGTGSVNYSDLGSDEVTGTAYSTLGLTSVTATTGGGVAWINFSPNPSWTSATFSTAGCMIYNSSIRNGGTSGTNTTGANRACAVYDFGGNQSVSSGTFSVLMPTSSSTAAVLRLG